MQATFKIALQKVLLCNLIFGKKESRMKFKKIIVINAKFWNTNEISIVRLGTWKTFHWKILMGEGKNFAPVWRIGICLPFPIVTFSLPLYSWTSERGSTSWERWCVAPMSKNYASSFMVEGDTNIACIWLLWLSLLTRVESDLRLYPWN